MKNTILIIDDHPLFREGLKSIIQTDNRFEVIAEAGNGADGFRLAKKFSPDIVLIDISLPDQSGIELTLEIKKLREKTHILIVSMHSNINYIAEAFQAGATGYVVKESAHDRLLQGIDIVSKGEYFLDSSVSYEVVKKLMGFPDRQARISDSAYTRLTPREQEIMRFLAEGHKPKDIAGRLCISPKTVENHRANIMQKLELHSTIELVRYAAKLGLIDVDLWKE